MSKINQNKIVALLFGLIALTLIFLSFQKNSSKTKIENIEEKIEVANSQDENNKIEIDDYLEENISEEVGEQITREQVLENELDFEISYLNYDFILDSKQISGIFIEGDSLYDSLLKMKEKELIDFEDKNFSGLGSYIYSINGISENKREGEYWIYYVNGQKANIGVSNYLLNEKDEIRWQLENNT
jgi:hypothetical protein